MDSMNLLNYRVKKGKSYLHLFYSPLFIQLEQKGSKNNSLYIYQSSFVMYEYLLLDRFAINSYVGLGHGWASRAFSMTSNLPKKERSYYYGLGLSYYPKIIEKLNTSKSSIHFNVPLYAGFHRVYNYIEVPNLGSHSRFDDGALSLGYGINFHLKNIYGIPANRMTFSFFRVFPVHFFKSLRNTTSGIEPIKSERRFYANVLGFGIKYSLDKPNQYMVKTRKPDLKILDNFYAKGNLHLNLNVSPRNMGNYEDDSSSLYGGIVVDAEYFFKKRISGSVGALIGRTLKGVGNYTELKENKFTALANFYPKINPGVRRFSISMHLGAGSMFVSHYTPQDPTNIEYNFKFSTYTIIGGFGFQYKPIRIFGKENNRIAFSYRSIGALYTLNSLTRFQDGVPFEIGGFGILKGNMMLKYNFGKVFNKSKE